MTEEQFKQHKELLGTIKYWLIAIYIILSMCMIFLIGDYLVINNSLQTSNQYLQAIATQVTKSNH